ncbi:hypothetical protein GJ744_005212 [Endocarpon pusillum]|uniref:Uncharacterized protein n=1 Tax=Endocarpon pusillum TaxID=364733 RepID=A0A8H7A8V2_9EURO|nr:hypothetical protein GJ744_005212 [Endocarpon pusillum]
MSSLSSYNFGDCSNPGITYDSSQLSFAPSNTDAFPFSSSSDIAKLESKICDRLRGDECSASPEAIAACDRARRSFSGYAGQQAAEAWNEALGVDGDGPVRVAAPSLTDDAYASDASSSTVVFVLATSMIRSDSSSTSSRTLFSEAPSSSSSSSLTSVSATTTPQPMTTAQSTPASSSSTRPQTSSPIPATTSEISNGSPFDPQTGSSPPRNPRKTVLTLMTIFLVLAPLI